jgi:hypothetical protein
LDTRKFAGFSSGKIVDVLVNYPCELAYRVPLILLLWSLSSVFASRLHACLGVGVGVGGARVAVDPLATDMCRLKFVGVRARDTRAWPFCCEERDKAG